MTARLQHEQAIFEEARKAESPAARQALLDQKCGEDDELKHRVLALLRASEEGESFLESPAPGLVAAPFGSAESRTFERPITERPGSVIGPYKLLQQIGEGGMGVVFMAEQTEPIQRIVALKIIKPGMDSRQVIARFEAERQAVAMMDHPNIAKVLDAGTTASGRPYFVMELVKGVPITKYCDDKHLPIRGRLELFIEVCQAVQHAHQKGIIHRDIKPTNVLVAEYDNHAVPKVIDFGVAKATAQKLTERTMFTEFGQVLGTMEYMSPEQAKLNQLDIDTRSDIYSLGVLLYELLTGSTPFGGKRLHEAAFDEMLRIIREEEPPKPSTRLSTTDQLPSIAANRSLEPKKLGGLVRGELDWIVMMALEKDRNRRYETANGLARDIERHLRDEPVQACPPSTGYRFRKFATRNKAGLLTAALLSFVLIAGTVISIWQAMRAHRAEIVAEQRLAAETDAHSRAVTEAAKAKAISDFLQQMLASANPDEVKEANYSVRQLLDDFSAGLGDQLVSQPEVEAEVRLTMARAYQRLGAAASVDLHLGKALQLLRRVVGPDHPMVADCLVDQAWSFGRQKRIADAEQAISEALRIYRLQGIQGQAYMKALWIRQNQLIGSARHDEAAAVTDEALALAARSPDIDFPDLASILHRHANELFAKQQYAAAEELARRSVQMHRRLHGEEHPETAWGLRTLGRALEYQKKFAEAESVQRESLAIFRKRLGDDHETTAAAFDLVKRLLKAQGKTAELEALALERQNASTKTANRQEAAEWLRLGQTSAARKKWAATVVAYTEAFELSEEVASAPEAARQLMNSAAAAEEAGKRDTAINLYELASRVLEKTVVANPDQYQARHDLNDCYRGLFEALWYEQRIKESTEVVRKDLKSLDRALIDFPEGEQWFLERQGHSYGYLGYRLWALRDYAAARDAFSASSDVFRRCIEKLPPDRKAFFLLGQGGAVRNISQIWETEGRADEAKTAWREALGYYELILNEKLANIGPGWINQYHSQFAQVLEKVGTLEDAKGIAPKLKPPGPELDSQGLRGLANCHIQVAHLFQDAGYAPEAEAESRNALAVYDRAIELNPQDWENWRDRGWLRDKLGDWDKSESDFAKVIELQPKHSDGWSGRAFSHFHRQQWEPAIADFSKAAELDPHVHMNWFHRGHSYLQLAQWDDAAADFTKIVDGWPDEPGGWYLRALAYAQSNQPEKAIADLRQAISKGLEDAEQLKNEPKLDPLRTREDFSKLLEESERKEKEKSQSK